MKDKNIRYVLKLDVFLFILVSVILLGHQPIATVRAESIEPDILTGNQISTRAILSPAVLPICLDYSHDVNVVALPFDLDPTVDNLWDTINSWTYQLSDYTNDRLDEIASSNFDLAIVDLARDGSVDFFTKSEIQTVQATGKVVLAYFEIGAIEDYRPEWDDVPNDLKLGAVGGWPSEQYVKYWDERWWPIVQGRVDQALNAGFDGAYLDMIVTYEEIPAGSAGTNRDDLAQKMVNLISRLSTYAKSIDPNFKIVPQNSPELYVYSGYLAAVDGLGIEELYIRATDKPCTRSWCYENQANAAEIRNSGKLVFSIDYANQESNIDSAYTQSLDASFVPYVSVRALDEMRINEGWEPELSIAIPAAVTNLLFSIQENDILLTWGETSQDTDGQLLTTLVYRIYRSTTANFTPSLDNMVGEVVTTAFTDPGAVSGLAYHYAVTAVGDNIWMRESEPSRISSDPTSVSVVGLSAVPTHLDNAIQVSWITISEIDTAGFNVWRSTSAYSNYTKVNAGIIPATAPGSSESGIYRFNDTIGVPGAAYFYTLEEIKTSGLHYWYGPVQAMPPVPTRVTTANLSGRGPSGFAGIILLIGTAGSILLLCRHS